MAENSSEIDNRHQRVEGHLTEATDAAQVSPSPLQNDLAMLYCPVCSNRLQSHRCKLICAQCGYFMSCADYY